MPPPPIHIGEPSRPDRRPYRRPTPHWAHPAAHRGMPPPPIPIGGDPPPPMPPMGGMPPPPIGRIPPPMRRPCRSQPPASPFLHRRHTAAHRRAHTRPWRRLSMPAASGEPMPPSAAALMPGEPMPPHPRHAPLMAAAPPGDGVGCSTGGGPKPPLSLRLRLELRHRLHRRPGLGRRVALALGQVEVVEDGDVRLVDQPPFVLRRRRGVSCRRIVEAAGAGRRRRRRSRRRCRG